MKKIIIAIDGPSGSGKSTTAREVAKLLGYIYIDTGAMYRAVTLAAMRNNIDFTDEALLPLLEKINIEIKQGDNGQRTFLDGEDVSSDIRTPEVTKAVSPVSALITVREKLVDMQRKMGENGGVVMDGRDIGTVVFPNAELKIFMIASLEARGIRRSEELKNSGITIDAVTVSKQLEDRDKYDSSRENSPLTKADDAIIVDTSGLSIEEQTNIVVNLAKQIINNN